MKYSLLITFVLYATLGFLLGIGGIDVVDNTLTFLAILGVVLVIEHVGRWDEIGRRYRG